MNSKEIQYTISELFTLLGVVGLFILLAFIATGTNKKCSDNDFEDIKSLYVQVINNTYYVNNTFYSNYTQQIIHKFKVGENKLVNDYKSEMKIEDMDDDVLGSYVMIDDGKDNKFLYIYRDDEDKEYVMAKIKKSSLLAQSKYELARCDGTGDEYEYKEIVPLNPIDDSRNYQLFRNNDLIGETGLDDIYLCKPGITIQKYNSTEVIAELTRSCDSLIVGDQWKVMNYDFDIDNYVIGFLAFITTLNDSE
jgi:hypothetical protein